MRAVTGQLRAMCQQYGGTAALDAALGFAGWAQQMLGSRQTAAVGRDLRIALGELHSMIGWSQHDVGRPARMRRHYFQALALARDADEPDLAADTLSDLAHATLETGRAHDALRLARIGLAVAAEQVSTSAIAQLHMVEGRAWARLGDEHGAREALDRAEDALGRAGQEQAPSWAYSSGLLLDPGHVTGIRLEVYEELSRYPEHRRYAEAAAELGQAATLDDPTRSYRSRILNLVSLAAAQLRAGGRDQGVTTAYVVLGKLSVLRSARVRARLTSLTDATAGYRANLDVDDLRTQLAALSQ